MTLLPSNLEFPPNQHPAVTDVHVPHRPEWWCRDCHEDWPCATARPALRRQLTAQPAQTRIYLAGQYEQAQSDLGGYGPDLWRRIVELREPGGEW